MLRTAILVAALGLLSACATTEAPSGATTTTPSASGTTAGGTPPAAPPAAAGGARLSAAADAEGKQIFENGCTTCHDAATTTSERKTAAQWEGTINDMISRGAIVSDADAVKLKAYLAAHYGA